MKLTNKQCNLRQIYNGQTQWKGSLSWLKTVTSTSIIARINCRRRVTVGEWMLTDIGELTYMIFITVPNFKDRCDRVLLGKKIKEP